MHPFGRYNVNPHYKNNPSVTVTDNGVSLDVKIERVTAGNLSLVLWALKVAQQPYDQTEFVRSLHTKLWDAMEENAKATGMSTQRPIDFAP